MMVLHSALRVGLLLAACSLLIEARSVDTTALKGTLDRRESNLEESADFESLTGSLSVCPPREVKHCSKATAGLCHQYFTTWKLNGKVAGFQKCVERDDPLAKSTLKNKFGRKGCTHTGGALKCRDAAAEQALAQAAFEEYLAAKKAARAAANAKKITGDVAAIASAKKFGKKWKAKASAQPALVVTLDGRGDINLDATGYELCTKKLEYPTVEACGVPRDDTSDDVWGASCCVTTFKEHMATLRQGGLGSMEVVLELDRKTACIQRCEANFA